MAVILRSGQCAYPTGRHPERLGVINLTRTPDRSSTPTDVETGPVLTLAGGGQEGRSAASHGLEAAASSSSAVTSEVRDG